MSVAAYVISSIWVENYLAKPRTMCSVSVMFIQSLNNHSVCLWLYITQQFYDLIVESVMSGPKLCTQGQSSSRKSRPPFTCIILFGNLYLGFCPWFKYKYFDFYNFRVRLFCSYTILSKYCQNSSLFHFYLLDPTDLILSQNFSPSPRKLLFRN